MLLKSSTWFWLLEDVFATNAYVPLYTVLYTVNMYSCPVLFFLFCDGGVTLWNCRGNPGAAKIPLAHSVALKTLI